MSEVLKLNIKSKSLKAVVSSDDILNSTVTEYDEDTLTKDLEKKYNDGYEQGYLKAKEELEQFTENEILQKAESFYNILANFEETLKEYDNDFLTIVVNVSKAIAEKIVRQEVQSSEFLEETLRESTSKIIGANDVIIKLNPEDYNFLTQNDKVSYMNSKFSRIKFESDSKIEMGGCFIETEIGNVDARISTQISELVKALENKLLRDEK